MRCRLPVSEIWPQSGEKGSAAATGRQVVGHSCRSTPWVGRSDYVRMQPFVELIEPFPLDPCRETLRGGSVQVVLLQ